LRPASIDVGDPDDLRSAVQLPFWAMRRPYSDARPVKRQQRLPGKLDDLRSGGQRLRGRCRLCLTIQDPSALDSLCSAMMDPDVFFARIEPGMRMELETR